MPTVDRQAPVKTERVITRVIEYPGAFCGSIGITPLERWLGNISERSVYWVGTTSGGRIERRGFVCERRSTVSPIDSFESSSLQYWSAMLPHASNGEMRLPARASFESRSANSRIDFDIHHFALHR